MADPTTMTAVPGITHGMAQTLMNCPDADEISTLVTLMAKYLPHGNYGPAGENTATGRDIKTMTRILDAIGAALPLARMLGKRLDEMTDAEKMMVGADQVNQLAEMVSGYRKTLLAGEIPANVADQMALQMHSSMMIRASQAAASK